MARTANISSTATGLVLTLTFTAVWGSVLALLVSLAISVNSPKLGQRDMRHRDIEYLVVQGIGRNVWKWSVAFDADHRVAGQTMTKAEAISRAERAIDRALAAKKLRLVSGRDQTNFGCRFRCYDHCFYYYARYFAVERTKPSSSARSAVVKIIAVASGMPIMHP